MSRVNGVVVGQVRDVEDPQSEGRVRVEFPWLSGDAQGYWAPVASLMSGNDRGAWFMPEVGDEVLVAFDHGDVNHPFIIGFLWNGDSRPPNSDINGSVRRLRTVSGHVVEFDDNSGQERILIETQGHHQIEMKDNETVGITIKTNGGHQIEMKDTPVGGIAIKTSGQQEITVDDAAGSITIKNRSMHQITITDSGITISTSAGMLTVNCLNANITASAMTNLTTPMLVVNAPISVFSGIVQIPTLIAQSVVGMAYTPAPGNTFGL